MRRDPVLLVFGGGGQLGTALAACDRLGTLRIVRHDRATTDITDARAVAMAIGGVRPDVVVNAAAYTAVDLAESERQKCFAANRDGAGLVADACARARVPLIHLSTDYVFDGGQAMPYREYDQPAPLNVYGVSKLAGEAQVAAATRRHVILRSAWVFGPRGGNFRRTVLRLAEAGKPLRIVADQVGCPTPAAALAEAIATMSVRIVAGDGAWGIFHFVGRPAISWHGFAAAIVRAAFPGGDAPPVLPISSAEYPTAARRPAQSVLSCERIAAAYGLVQPEWLSALSGHGMHEVQAQTGNPIRAS
jgi:dTDP-4-dehydrorhamnose reductase